MLIDLPIDPFPYVMSVEYHLNEELISVECGPLSHDVSLAEAQRFAAALDAFLSVPENAAQIDPSFHDLLVADLRLNFDSQFGVINHGPWALRCSPPKTFRWRMQPARHVEYTAFLSYDEARDIWFVSHLSVKQMRPRG